MTASRTTGGVLAVVAAGMIASPAASAAAEGPGAVVGGIASTVTDALRPTTAETPPTPTPTTDAAPPTSAPAPPAPAPATTETVPTRPPATTATTPAAPPAPADSGVGDDSGGTGRKAEADRASRHRRAAKQARDQRERRQAASERRTARQAAAKARRDARKARAGNDERAAADLGTDDAAGTTGTGTGTGTGAIAGLGGGDAASLLTPPSAVPNFFLDRFKIPPFLLPIYQAAGVQYGVRWEILAAINEIETNFGRNLNVSSAGALGWMQFMPATWAAYGVDANGDDKADPVNPVDAIFAAARYLKAAGAETDIRKAIFAYNHADWYVDSVMVRARLISGLPADLVGSLTGLTQGVFPVSGDATYAGAPTDAADEDDDGSTALRTDEDDAEGAGPRRSIEIKTKAGANAVAVQDGTVTALGRTDSLGHYVQLRDVFGNRYTYAHLDEIAKTYPAAASDRRAGDADAVEALDVPKDPVPRAPATAGRQRRSDEPATRRTTRATRPAAVTRPAPKAAARPSIFANPSRSGARWGHGRSNVPAPAPAAAPGDLSATDRYTTPPARATPAPATEQPEAAREGVEQRPLRRGARVVGGTVLGTVGRAPAPGEPATSKRASMTFGVRPAGKGAPRIDPKPLLDGWKLLASTEVYRAKDANALFGAGGRDASAGQVLLMSKAQLEQRVLADKRLEIYPIGREQIRAGQVDRRILATLAFLSANGHRVAVSSLRRSGAITSAGNVSEHDSGNAVDIAAVDGQRITRGTQGAGTVTERAIRLLLQLQGTMKPHQIISLMTPSDFGGAENLLALPDHDDHIHVGFHVETSASPELGQQLASALKPAQWDDLIERLGKIENPDVPKTVSRYAVRAKKQARDR